MILHCDKIGVDMVDQIGGKARGLLFVMQQGLRVPVWCVIPSASIQKNLISKGFQLSKDDEIAIEQWMNDHIQPHESVIVRSSALGEDGAEASFAGMFESFPNLKTEDQIFEAIEKCVHSASSLRVAEYRSRMRVDASEMQMAVIIQKQIQVDKSGVLLTSNLAMGNPSQVLISALWGQGQGVVDGRYTSDEYQIDLYPWKVKAHVAQKTHIVSLSSSSGVEIREVPVQDQLRPVLSEKELQSLVEVGVQLEKACGKPQDIEWGIVQGQIHVLQSRDIVEKKPSRRMEEFIVLDNSNIQESFQGPTLPLTFSYATEVYQEVYVRLMVIMGFSRATVKAHMRRQGQMLALVRGRVYYNINSWYEGLLLMPGFQKNKTDMEKMMGVSRPVPFIEDQQFTFVQKLLRLPAILKTVFLLSWHFLFLKRSSAQFLSNVRRICENFDSENLDKMPPRYLNNYFQKIRAEVLNVWTAPIVNDFYVMIYCGKVRRMLEKVDRPDLFAAVLAGGDVESLKPLRLMSQMAQIIKASPKLKSKFIDENMELDQLTQNGDQLTTLLQEFLHLYGDRVPGELKLETITFRDDLGKLSSIVRSMIQSESGVYQWSHASPKDVVAIQEAGELIRKKIGKRGEIQFRVYLKKARQGILWREAMRLERTRSFGLARRVYKILGQRFFELGVLLEARDIFYLTTYEVDHLLNGKSVHQDVQKLVFLRKQQYLDWQSERLPSQIFLRVPSQTIDLISEELPIQEQDLSGIGCFPGEIEAEVVLVQDPFQCPDLAGKILVTERTDPGWTPLFSQIQGLLVEKGSTLSHSAVVAREMGIPTVVNVPGLMQKLKTGQRVRMNGATGGIEILTSTEESDVSFLNSKEQVQIDIWN